MPGVAMKDPSRTATDVIARSSAGATARSAFCHSLVVSAGLLAAGCGQLSPRGEALNTPLNSTPTTVPPGASSSAAGWDGAYAGKGFLERDPGGTCETEMPVYGMRVAGTRVTFGSFSGAIGPDGSIDMVYGRTRIIGNFGGNQFNGQVSQPFPGCTYRLQLSRTG